MGDDDICQAHKDWALRNGGRWFHHAYEHHKGDFCYWCGRHRTDPNRVRPNPQTYTEDEWLSDYLYQELGIRFDDGGTT